MATPANILVFDIESEPQPEGILRKLLPPLDESKFKVGEFDLSSVNIKHLKRQELIDEKIEAARKAHQQTRDLVKATTEAARQKHWEDFRDAAPLNAAYGRVLAIGLYAPEDDQFLCDPWPSIETDERDTLRRVWSKFVACIQTSRPIVGLNIFQFDLPFMLRRSWILGVGVPNIIVRDVHTKWPKWHERFIDLRQCWLLGSSWDTKSNFATLAHAFDTAGKTEEEGGKYFWKLWRDDRERAIDYLKQDVRQPAEWAARMGVR